METGNDSSVHDLVVSMGRAVRNPNDADAQRELTNIRDARIAAHALMAPCTDITRIATGVEQSLAYLCGYMPHEYGNRALHLLDLEHPVFGRNLDTAVDQALAAGVRLADEYREVKAAEERKAKRLAAAKRGIDLPDVDTAVTSATAKNHFDNLRKIRAGEKLEALEESALKALGTEAPRPVTYNPVEKLIGKDKEDAAAKAALAAKAMEDDEDDYEVDDEEIDLDAAPTPAVVVTPTSMEEIERMLNASEDAGAF